MDGKIYDLLKKIDDFKIEKFGLSKDNRILLKKLLISDSFSNDFVLKLGSEKVIDFLQGVYNSLASIKDSIIDLKSKSQEIDEVKQVISSNFGDDLESVERDRELALETFIRQEIEKDDFIKHQENIANDDDEKRKQILNNLNNK